MNKYLKLSLILLVACISSFFIYENTSAATLNQAPYFGYNYVLSSYDDSLVPTGGAIYSSNWGGTPIWLSDATYYSWSGSTSPAPVMVRYWWNKNLNLCNGGETVLKGTFIIGGSLNWNDFKPYVQVSTTDYASRRLCTYTLDSSSKSRIHFTCTVPNWSGASGLNFFIDWTRLPLASAHIVLTQDLNYTCEISTADVINNQNQNTQSIINNNNQNSQNIINNQNKNQQETNKNLNKIDDSINKTNDFLTDDTAPNSDISGLGNVQGLLPAGPVDSLLNIPFEFLSILTSSFSDTCVDMSFNFVFNQKFTIPCFDSIYDEMSPALLILVDTIPAAFILIKYFKYLYKKVDRATSLETTDEDEWGVL